MVKHFFKLAALVLLFCRSAAAQQEATLSGRIANHESDSLTLSWRATPFDEREHTMGVLLDARGEFQLRVPLNGPLLVHLSVGNDDTPVFLEPGNSLRVKMSEGKEAAEFRFQAAEGASPLAAAANNYLNDFSLVFVEQAEYQVLPANIKLKESEFLSFLQYRQEQQNHMLKAVGKDKLTPTFRAFAEAEIAYGYANDHLTYPELRAETMGNEVMPVGATFYQFLDKPTLLAAGAGAGSGLSPQYQDFALNYVHYLVRKAGRTPADVGYYPACYQMAGQRLTGESRAVVQGMVVRETIRHGYLGHAEKLLADYAAHSSAPAAWAQQLREQLATYRAHAVGSPAPALPAGLRSLQGDTVTLARYAGNLVYLLMWDTRLPASQREIAPLKQLMAQFAGKPIKFVVLALDEDAASWRRLVATDPPLPGVQVLVPPTASAALRAAYDPTVLPAAALIAEDGTLLQYHARKPSHLLLPQELKAAFGRATAYRAVPLP